MLEFDILDVISEQNLLFDAKKDRMRVVKDELNFIWQQEGTKRVRGLGKGIFLKETVTRPTFMMLLNNTGEKRKFDFLNGPISNTANVLRIASSFYMELFGHEVIPNISFGDNFWDADDTNERSFHAKWFKTRGSFCVTINDENSPYFLARWSETIGPFCVRINDENSPSLQNGVKKGGPLSPNLFNFIAYVYSKILLIF
jgi:hypothetical protein